MKVVTLVLSFAAVLAIACDPRRAPVIRSFIEASDRELTKQARQAIEKDPVLKELDRVCTGIELPEDAALTRMGGLGDRSIQISYYYSSTVAYSEARPMWKAYFAKNGWNERKEEDTFPHQELGFFNSEYEATIYFGGLGKKSGSDLRYCDLARVFDKIS